MKGIRIIALAIFGLLLAGYGCFGPVGTAFWADAVGFGPALFESIAACPAAVEKLGSPVRFGRTGVGCGNWEKGGDSGEGVASGGMPLTGPQGSARVDYTMTLGGGVWRAVVLVLTLPDGSKLDVKACSAGLEQQRGVEGLNNLLTQACEDGRADMCLNLSLTLQAQGDEAGAKAAKNKACKLGLASACGN
jgi:hypothetical protein